MQADDILIIDDFVDVETQDYLLNTLLYSSFRWFYTPDVTSLDKDDTRQNRPCMSFLLMDKGNLSSGWDMDLDKMAESAARRYGYPSRQIWRAKTILQFPLNPSLIGEEVDDLHIDMPKPFVPHLVLLYYVMDADGDTLLTDLKATPGEDCHAMPCDDSMIVKRVTPRKGRAVIFNGDRYHTAVQPKMGMRCIININIV